MIDYKTRYRCKSCKHYLGYHSILYTYGCCRYCGAQSGGTVVDAEEVSGQWVRSGAWWQFWKPLKWIEKGEK